MQALDQSLYTIYLPAYLHDMYCIHYVSDAHNAINSNPMMMTGVTQVNITMLL